MKTKCLPWIILVLYAASLYAFQSELCDNDTVAPIITIADESINYEFPKDTEIYRNKKDTIEVLLSCLYSFPYDYRRPYVDFYDDCAYKTVEGEGIVNNEDISVTRTFFAIDSAHNSSTLTLILKYSGVAYTTQIFSVTDEYYNEVRQNVCVNEKFKYHVDYQHQCNESVFVEWSINGSPMASGDDIEKLWDQPGEYELKVRVYGSFFNKTGADEIKRIFVTAPAPDVIALPTTCASTCDGGFQVIAEENQSYAWLNSEGTEIGNEAAIYNLCNGAYTLRVTDGSGCVVLKHLKIESKLPYEISIGNENCQGEGHAFAEVLVKTPSLYDITWSDGSKAFKKNKLLPGLYPFTLRHTTSACQFEDTVVITTAVRKPKAGFEIIDKAYVNEIVVFKNTSIDHKSSLWNFGEGSEIIYNADTVKYIYARKGIYTVKLKVANEACSDSTYKEVVVTTRPINKPPTLNDLPDLVIDEDAELKTIPLSGITAGFGEDQPLTVSARSNNKDLIYDPEVSYFSPSSTGSLSIFAVEDSYGQTTVSVSVNDGGENGIITKDFRVTVNPINDPPALDNLPSQIALYALQKDTLKITGITAGPKEMQAVTITATSDNPSILPNPKVEFNSTDSSALIIFSPPFVNGTTNVQIQLNDNGDNTPPNRNQTLKKLKATVEKSTGIDKRLKEVIVYPIPARNELVIDFRRKVGEMTVIILDQSGRKLKEKSVRSLPCVLDLTDLSKGLYLLRLSLDDFTIVQKVVKE